MRIENYLGFPTGLTGSELADRAVLQANKFGARLSVPTPAISLTFDNVYPVLRLDGAETVVGKCLLIATGTDYRRLDVEGSSRLISSADSTLRHGWYRTAPTARGVLARLAAPRASC
jgi:thioredoxin reductase (NADPH)